MRRTEKHGQGRTRRGYGILWLTAALVAAILLGCSGETREPPGQEPAQSVVEESSSRQQEREDEEEPPAEESSPASSSQEAPEAPESPEPESSSEASSSPKEASSSSQEASSQSQSQSQEEGEDPYLLEILWHALQDQGISVASPQDITSEELGRLEQVSLDYSWVSPPEGYRMDGSLLRSCPNLIQVYCAIPLKDYSVCEEMDELEWLEFNGQATMNGFDFSTLQVGRTETLSVREFGRDMAVDLSGVNARRLELQSWSSGVTAFSGCEDLEGLSLFSTTTDTTLLTREAFPGLLAMDLEFGGDRARVRDLSRLATFPEEVEISVRLNYHACNNETMASLEGVSVDTLVLDPYEGGEYPLEDLDLSLADRIPAKEMRIRQNPSDPRIVD